MNQIDILITRIRIVAIIFCGILLFSACNVIPENEFQIEYTQPDEPKVSVRTMLLEDYTGIRCTNCPNAAAEAGVLKSLYNERLIVVSIHAGAFAKPYQGYDLTTLDGTAYNKYYDISAYPQGVVCRKPYKGNLVSIFQQWAGALEAIPNEAPVTLDMAITYNEETRAYSLELGILGTTKSATPNYDLLLWLVEDHVLTPQTMTNGKWAYDYDQRHVFRGAINNTWGESITMPAKDEKITIKKDGYLLSQDYESYNCSVVALICDATTKEVVQAIESPLNELPK